MDKCFMCEEEIKNGEKHYTIDKRKYCEYCTNKLCDEHWEDKDTEEKYKTIFG